MSMKFYSSTPGNLLSGTDKKRGPFSPVALCEGVEARRLKKRLHGVHMRHGLINICPHEELSHKARNKAGQRSNDGLWTLDGRLILCLRFSIQTA